MPSALDVARYFLHLAAMSKELSPVTHMQLHKLMYYAQGWSLASRNRPLFDGTFQAWTHGPVAVELYQTFKGYDKSQLPLDLASDGADLTSDQRGQIESIWSHYGKYAAWQLREMTHNEAPWRNARGDLPEGARSETLITNDSLRAHFYPLHEQACKKIEVSPDFLSAQADESTLIPWEVVKAEMLARVEEAGIGGPTPRPRS